MTEVSAGLKPSGLAGQSKSSLTRRLARYPRGTRPNQQKTIRRKLSSVSELMSIKSKSKVVPGADGPAFPSGTAETVSGPVGSQEQRIEQMYQLADIFASIFEALANEHEDAIAASQEAA
jgi:hypothetical protein